MNSTGTLVHDACFGPMSHHASETGIDAIFRQQAARCPTAIAAVYGAQELCYAELDRRATRLAAYLKQRGIRAEEPVGILLEPGLDQIVCQLAVIRAGGSCLPLDPGAPDERLKLMVDDLSVRVVLTAAGLPRITVAELVPIEESAAWPSDAEAEAIIGDETAGAGHRTHILFTSGTTGRPKAVEILARGIVRLTVNTHYVALSSNDRFAAIANPAFDASLFEIWGALLNGATVVLLPKQTCIDPHALRHSLHVQRITVMFITTALFNQTVHAYPDAFRGLHQLLFGGEAVNPQAVRAMFIAAPPRRVVHVYGPTEGTTFSLYHDVSLEEVDAGSIPIGKPIDNSQVFVLNDEQRPVQNGETGEIYIGGDGVARGYWNRPELNRERFVEVDHLVEGKVQRLYRTGDLGSRRTDGALNFHGRNDNQVKIRGHRIEIEEIEAVLLASGLVRDAVVTVQQTELGDKYLRAFVVRHDEQSSSELPLAQDRPDDQLARYLASQLPVYMRPRLSFVKLLPMNANGKVDRRALIQQHDEPVQEAQDAQTAGHGVNTPEESAKANDLVAAICSMWCRTLDIEAADADDDFFELGGDSLQAARLILQLSKHVRYPLPVQALYDHPTPSGLAAYLGKRMQLNGGFTSVDEMAALRADARLPDDIQALAGSTGPWLAAGKGHVFVTGATGFLGAFVLRDLLHMSEVVEVACLVRAPSNGEALVRIRDNMMKYGTWEDAFFTRLKPLAGNLADADFGLGHASFEALSKTTDVIFHLGAHVNYIQPYSAHRTANVDGTINVLRFATTGNVKPLHYVSTIAAFGPAGLLKLPRRCTRATTWRIT